MCLLLSCRTVEVNNTDAEGRLVLGDGVRLALIFLIILSLLPLFKGDQSRHVEVFGPQTKFTGSSS